MIKSSTKSALALIGLFLVLLAGFLAFFFLFNPADDRRGRNFSARLHTGETARLDELPGDYRLVYFGYLSCPDVCLTAALSIGGALRTLEEQDPELRARLTNVFVTIDPEEDLIDGIYNELEGYLDGRYGGQGFAMQPASVSAAKSIAGAFGIKFEYVVDEFFPSGYRVDHSSLIFLTDKRGNILSFYPDQTPGRVIASELLQLP